MRREARQLVIDDLVRRYADIDFPDYQREPNIWSRDQKQRLIDSILRDFDIASVYFYEKPNGDLECIDGRQRLTTIMAFLNATLADDVDNGFPLRFHNEISATVSEFDQLTGKTHAELQELAHSGEETAGLARLALDRLHSYSVTAIYLSDVTASEEFNLQFLRLNLGTLINAGEKLHAMVGRMRDLLFESPRIGHHPFFEELGIPTRRYSKEQVAAQVMIQAFSYARENEFTRARHFDLQRFVKAYADIDPHERIVDEVASTLDALTSVGLAEILRNRAIAVSVVLVAWVRRMFENPELLAVYGEFVPAFLDRLRLQVERMKHLEVDDRYPYLVDFQRHVTQASVEKPALAARHAELTRQLDYWLDHHALVGDPVAA